MQLRLPRKVLSHIKIFQQSPLSFYCSLKLVELSELPLLVRSGGTVCFSLAEFEYYLMSVIAMPQQLAKNLSGQLDQTAIDTIFGSITVAIADYPRGTAAYQGIVAAYTQVMEWILIPATCFAVIPLIAAFFVKNLVLGNVRNVVEEEDAVSIADSDKKHGY